MLIYIAAPYSQGDVVENVRQACLAGDEVLKKGHIPFVPHLSHLWHLISPKSYEEWLAIDLEYLERCDALVRLPGESKGADREVRYAGRLLRYPKIVIYYGVDTIPTKA